MRKQEEAADIGLWVINARALPASSFQTRHFNLRANDHQTTDAVGFHRINDDP
ncbi:hypothetical protein WN55_06731 [Dufourea novaeangliae]|nr:hypothetical protein WN55_06731 [Dufourea novaeangliae]